MSPRAPHLAALVLALAVGASAADTPPNLRNAEVTPHDASEGLDAVVRGLVARPGPAWIAYAVPLAGQHQMCCYTSMEGIGTGCPGCRLEGDGAFTTGGAARLEEDRELVVLLRAEGGRVGRVRTVSWSCGIDAGGRPLHWLTGVRPADSLRLLASLVGADLRGGKGKGAGNHKGDNGVLAAIAFHDHPDADGILERLAGPGQPDEVRRQAAFWMGNARGPRGYEALRRLVREDPSPKLREHAVFALGQSEVPQAVDSMLEVARRDADAHVRGQALFWLAQKAGRKAVEGITRAMEDDPDTDVKEKAVFALSQLPADEGVPLLLAAARSNRSPQVRKRAIFWLGQSEDPRALAFFAEVLGR